jgi:hypothetical protein
MPAFKDRGRFLCVSGGEGVSIAISPFLFAKELIPNGRDAGRSEDGACFRL